jgi:biopolymer transport protein ExbD
VVEHLSPDRIIDGLRDGAWEPTDEVRGPNDAGWQPLEDHPVFANAVAELEEAPPYLLHEDAEEQRIDMNPLIDVCLVLLVFFILATTMQVLERVLDLPTNQQAGLGNVPQLTPDQARERMILVQVRPGAVGTRFMIGDEAVSAAGLEAAVKRAVNQTRRQELLIDARQVDWGSVVQVIDAAAGARVRKVHFKVDAETSPDTPTQDM